MLATFMHSVGQGDRYPKKNFMHFFIGSFVPKHGSPNFNMFLHRYLLVRIKCYMTCLYHLCSNQGLQVGIFQCVSSKGKLLLNFHLQSIRKLFTWNEHVVSIAARVSKPQRRGRAIQRPLR
ncbi:unnamed protein product [Spodoptera exigua]|nr:unnamed protein product [Spodoptera exigua]